MKQFTKKLTLKKETITNMENILGGASEKPITYWTCNYSQCGTGKWTLVPCLCE